MKSFLTINKMDLLTSIYIFCLITAEIMGGKTFALARIFNFNLNASVAIFLLPILFSINDVITEVHGAERARSVVRSGLVTIVLVILFTLLALHLPASSRFAATEPAYETIFSVSARISLASLIAFAIADLMDVAIFTRLREKLGKDKLWLRNNASNMISEFFDTSIFMFLAFYAVNKSVNDNFVFLISLILPYWLLKCGMSVIETPLVYLGVKWLKKAG